MLPFEVPDCPAPVAVEDADFEDRDAATEDEDAAAAADEDDIDASTEFANVVSGYHRDESAHRKIAVKVTTRIRRELRPRKDYSRTAVNVD